MGDIPDLGQFTPVALPVPYMTREAYASHVGLPVGVIQGWIERGYLATVRVGKYNLINVALETRRALNREFVL